MPPFRYLTLVLSSLLFLACSFEFAPSSSALSIDSHHHFARQISRNHHTLLKRATPKRCKARPTSSAKSAPAPTSSAKAAPITTPPAPPNKNPSNGARKVGIAWAGGDDRALANFKTDKSSAIYTWSAWIPQNARKLGFEPMIMYWGPGKRDEFKRLAVKGYANTVLGFNEPDHREQANISPQKAAELWKADIQPLKSLEYKLITPACTNADSGIRWQRDFFDACGGECTFDGMALHYYGKTAKGMIDYVTKMHQTFGLNIMVTEFACQDFGGGPQASKEQVFQFMRTVTEWMDKTEWVTHYFAFGAMHNMGNVSPANQLMAGDGKPTALGVEYLN